MTHWPAWAATSSPPSSATRRPPLIQSLADGLCTAVREQSHATGTGRIPATISIGAVLFDAGTQTHHEALHAADTALHEAKVAGGDRAIVHESPQDG